MSKPVGFCALSLWVTLASQACGSDDAKNAPRHPYSAGQGGDGAAGESNTGGASDSGEPGGGAGAGAAVGAGAKGGADGSLAGQASSGEGGLGGQGGAGGESPTLNVLYATFGSKLVWLEPETGSLHEVGDLHADAVTYSDVLLGYTNIPGQALIVTPRYDFITDLPPPELGKVDLCTGVVSDLAPLTRVASPVRTVEGLALHPNGTWYIATGAFPAGGQQTQSNKLGTLAADTRVITDLAGTVTTVQNDVDSMNFVGDTLYAMDGDTVQARIELVTANLLTGAVTHVATPSFPSGTAVPLRFAYDATRGKAFGWRPSDRNLVELSLTDGTATPIGETHGADVYPGAVVCAFISAPPPACP